MVIKVIDLRNVLTKTTDNNNVRKSLPSKKGTHKTLKTDIRRVPGTL